MTGLYQVWGIAVSLAGYVVPCVRFNRFVRIYPKLSGVFTSLTTATLGMGGWLILAQKGLSPLKKRQALLDALTDELTRLK